jgi:hypothetical protein
VTVVIIEATNIALLFCIVSGGIIMKRIICTRIALALMLICAPAVLLAGDIDDRQENKKDTDTIVVVRGEDAETSVIFEDGMLTIISEDGDETSTHMIDMEAMGLMASGVAEEVMSELGTVMAELDDMQFQFRVGEDNRVNVSIDESEFELDLDEIMSQVSMAMEAGFSEFDTNDWSSRHDRQGHVDISDSELRAELHDLKAEIRELRRELRDTAKKSQ